MLCFCRVHGTSARARPARDQSYPDSIGLCSSRALHHREKADIRHQRASQHCGVPVASCHVTMQRQNVDEVSFDAGCRCMDATCPGITPAMSLHARNQDPRCHGMRPAASRQLAARLASAKAGAAGTSNTAPSPTSAWYLPALFLTRVQQAVLYPPLP